MSTMKYVKVLIKNRVKIYGKSYLKSILYSLLLITTNIK